MPGEPGRQRQSAVYSYSSSGGFSLRAFRAFAFGFSIPKRYAALVKYEGDPAKAKANLRKHRVAFEEAATVFLDPFAMTYPDPDHSDDEDREITIGLSARQRLLFVSHARRGDRIRIISAREATRKERKQHEEGII